MDSFHRKYKNTTTADQFKIKKWLELLRKLGRKFRKIVNIGVLRKTLQEMCAFVQKVMVITNALLISIRNA